MYIHFCRLVPHQKQSTAVAPRGRFDNAAEIVLTKLDDLVNWARKVCMYKCIIIYNISYFLSDGDQY